MPAERDSAQLDDGALAVEMRTLRQRLVASDTRCDHLQRRAQQLEDCLALEKEEHRDTKKEHKATTKQLRADSAQAVKDTKESNKKKLQKIKVKLETAQEELGTAQEDLETAQEELESAQKELGTAQKQLKDLNKLPKSTKRKEHSSDEQPCAKRHCGDACEKINEASLLQARKLSDMTAHFYTAQLDASKLRVGQLEQELALANASLCQVRDDLAKAQLTAARLEGWKEAKQN